MTEDIVAGMTEDIVAGMTEGMVSGMREGIVSGMTENMVSGWAGMRAQNGDNSRPGIQIPFGVLHALYQGAFGGSAVMAQCP